MAHVSADRVKETTSTTGTGALTLAGTSTGYQTFGAVLADGDTCFYTISSPGGAQWETGVGTYSTTGPTLSRTTVLSSSSSNAVVNLASGVKDVFLGGPATRLVQWEPTGKAVQFPSGGSTVASLPSASSLPGAIAVVTDAMATTGYATVVGGGAVRALVVADAGGWKAFPNSPWHVADRTALKSLPNANGTAILDEPRFEGLFKWDGSVSTTVHQADTLETRYVAPLSGSAGAWVRQDLPRLHNGGDAMPIDGRENLAGWYKWLRSRHEAPTAVLPAIGFFCGDSRPSTSPTATFLMSAVLTEMAKNRGLPLALFSNFTDGGQNSAYINSTTRATMMAHGNWTPYCNLVIFDAGTNDNSTVATGGAQTLAQTEANVRAFVAAVRNTGASPAGKTAADLSIIILGPTTANNNTAPHYQNEALMRNLSDIYRRVARETNCVFIDVYALWRRAHNEADWQDTLVAYGNTQVHRGDAFNALLAEVIGDLILPRSLAAIYGFGSASYEPINARPISTALPLTYRYGRTLARCLTTEGFPVDGVCETVRYANTVVTQTAIDRSTGAMHVRTCATTGGNVWTAWQKVFMGQLVANTILGNNTAGLADPTALTPAQVAAMLPAFVGSGASHAKGLVPDPGASAGSTKYLREDGAWAIPAGGSANVGSATVDFGAGDTTATVTVTGQSWVAAGSKILCVPSGEATADHSAEDYLLEQISAVATNRVAGAGFDIVAHAPNGARGQYIINFTGAWSMAVGILDNAS